jgi:hypothetical protein
MQTPESKPDDGGERTVQVSFRSGQDAGPLFVILRIATLPRGDQAKEHTKSKE